MLFSVSLQLWVLWCYVATSFVNAGLASRGVEVSNIGSQGASPRDSTQQAGNVYDVTQWQSADTNTSAYDDIGAVMNSIIADIKVRQNDQAAKPGALIFIPAGDYSLKTRVTIDVSYLTVQGTGHGFTSSSIRYNSANTSSWFEVNPGGSHIKVENTDGHAEAFLVSRDGDPRLSSVTFENFCLDGVSFGEDENSYKNGKIGIRTATPTDSLWITDMCIIYVEQSIIVYGADATKITDNMLAESGSLIEFVGYGQASLVADNLLGAGPYGPTIAAEDFFGLLITGNNVFPRGRDDVYLNNCRQSSISSNRFHAFYPGMVILANGSYDNTVSSNHFYREVEPFTPFVNITNGRDDSYGLLRIEGDHNSVMSNHFSYNVPSAKIRPEGASPVIINVQSGLGNLIAANQIVSASGSYTVQLGSTSTNCTVVDSCREENLNAETEEYHFRPLP